MIYLDLNSKVSDGDIAELDMLDDSVSDKDVDSGWGLEDNASDWSPEDNASGWGYGGEYNDWDAGNTLNDKWLDNIGNDFNYSNIDSYGNDKKESSFDKLFNITLECISKGFSVFKNTVLTIPQRTADELGCYCTDLVKSSVIIFCAGILVYFIRLVIGQGSSLFGKSLIYTISALLTSSIGFICFGIASFYAGKQSSSFDIDINDTLEEDEYNMYEKALNDYMEEEKGIDETYEDDHIEDSVISSMDYVLEDYDKVEEEIDYDKIIDSINGAIPKANRDILLNALIPLFKSNTPDFAEPKQMDTNSREFSSLNTLAVKALAKAAKKEINEITSRVIPNSVIETIYSYQFKMPRVKGLNKTSDIETEMVSYFSDNETSGVVTSNDSINKPVCIVTLDGDNYKITVTKGENYTITYGDLFKNGDVISFYRDTNNKLPFVAGVTELGQPVLLDGKSLDSMLIVGQPRSGKSWHLLNICMSFMFFNSPDEVQFIIVDPKESNIFKTVSLMPHIIGLHSVDTVLQLFKELIDVEAPRRKKILSDNYCENIWDLRKKGVTLPVIYLVLDEVITIIEKLGDGAKEFNSLLLIVLTQLPSLGIRPIILPHRANGVIDKTTRENIHYKAAIRATTEIVKETTGLGKWQIPLTSPGDSAIIIPTIPNGVFIHGVGITLSDFDNSELIEAVAKLHYKIGTLVDYPKWLKIAFNRNEKVIRSRLFNEPLNEVDNAPNTINIKEEFIDSVEKEDAEEDYISLSDIW